MESGFQPAFTNNVVCSEPLLVYSPVNVFISLPSWIVLYVNQNEKCFKLHMYCILILSFIVVMVKAKGLIVKHLLYVPIFNRTCELYSVVYNWKICIVDVETSWFSYNCNISRVAKCDIIEIINAIRWAMQFKQ